ncbi:MAG: L,D-transpeptidase family protein [Candidatus Aceula meridiana]|nr:L,D-transpeptidase family protein [Candidatus Aceula meridiana]
MKKKILIVAGVIAFLFFLKVLASPRGDTTPTQVKSNPKEVQALYKEAVTAEEGNDLATAKELYKNIMNDYPDFSEMEDVQKRLEQANLGIIFSKAQTPQTVIHVVEKGDSLSKLGKKYNCTVALIKKSNNLKNDIIRIGQRLRIWAEPFSVLVDKSQNKLILKSGDEVVKVYTVATGKDNSTPVGTFIIETKLVDPVWFKSGAIIPPDSAQNELGARWMGFDIQGYGIHGTTHPESLGQQATAGCVRMHNDDVKELYDLLTLNTQVTIVD